MENENVKKIPRRVLASIITSASAGVVPRIGAPYIAIGRKDEIDALLSDLELINDGGGTMRFIIGRYGSGKSFLIQLIRGYALERGFLTADCDLSPERRLYGTSGSGIATYRELMKNLASKSSPDGGALPSVLSRWLFDIREKLAASGIDQSGAEFRPALEKEVRSAMKRAEFMTGGFDFAKILAAYNCAASEGDDASASACLRWFRGEYSSRTEAKRELGFDVSMIVTDSNWYDFIKLWASVCPVIGYRGLLVFIDECVNLFKIPHRVSRENNYEKILSMFNDTLQGRSNNLGIVFGGTPQFLEDTRRGLFSYDALRSRLADGRFSSSGFRNYAGPVIRLKRLSDDELLALISRMTFLYSSYYNVDPRVGPEDQLAFLRNSLSRAGADSMITPREMIRDYMTLLDLLRQNPCVGFSEVSGITEEKGGAKSSDSGEADPDEMVF